MVAACDSARAVFAISTEHFKLHLLITNSCLLILPNKVDTRGSFARMFATRVNLTTIPARLAQTARVSHSLQDAQSRARTLYRNWYRGVSSQTLALIRSLISSPLLEHC
jgi:hypothetical protein